MIYIYRCTTCNTDKELLINLKDKDKQIDCKACSSQMNRIEIPKHSPHIKKQFIWAHKKIK